MEEFMDIAVQEITTKNTLPALVYPLTSELKPVYLIDRIIEAVNKKQNYLSYHLMRKLSVNEFRNLPDITLPQQSGDYAWELKLSNLVYERNVFTSGIVQAIDSKQEDPILFGFEDKATYMLPSVKSYKPVDIIKNFFYSEDREKNNFGRSYSGGHQVKGLGRRICFDETGLYSYGQDIAHRIKNGFIVNGDLSTPTTNGDVNYAFHIAPLGTPIIPFSVIEQANLKDYDKLELIQASSDWYETIQDPDGKDKYIHHLGETLFKYENRYFLSTLEARRYRQHYYLLELNKAAASIEQAKHQASGLNDEQWLQYQNGKIKRQGEYLFIPVNIKDYVGETLFKIKDYIEKNRIQMRPINGSYGKYAQPGEKELLELGNIFGQPNGNPHYPRDVVRMGGNVFVRGTVRHLEHGMLRFGEQWHLAQLNYIKRAYQPNGRVD
jgi:hypothetical protein